MAQWSSFVKLRLTVLASCARVLLTEYVCRASAGPLCCLHVCVPALSQLGRL